MARKLISISGALLALLLFAACGDRSEVAAPVGVSFGDSPLEEYRQLATGFQGTAEDQLRQIEKMESRVDELIAQCMHDAGFAYTPRTTDDDGNTVIHLGPDDESVSELEVAAWWEAYWGPGFDQDADGEYIWEFERAGCGGQAKYIAERQFNLGATDEFRPLFEAMRELEVSLWGEPELMALNSEWSYCMADAGYPGLSNPETIPTRESVADAQDLANLNCLEITNYIDRATEIVFTAERQFIADHRAELNALRDAAEQGANY